MYNLDQGLISRAFIYKDLLQITKKNQEHTIEKWANDIKKELTAEIQVENCLVS